MQINDTTYKSGIFQMIEATTNRTSGDITSDATEKAYFLVLINQWYRVAAFLAWKSSPDWIFDDPNHSTFPMATTTIINNQRDYPLPSTALSLMQVENMDANGKYYTLEFMDEKDAVLLDEKEQEDAGIPTHYRVVSNSLKLYPKPDTSQITAAAGLRVTVGREIDAFGISDTSQEPGLPAFLQPILYYGPSFEWASTRSRPEIANLCFKMLGNFPGLMDMVSDFYGKRNQEVVRKIARKSINWD